jgi:hypothetical protein
MSWLFHYKAGAYIPDESITNDPESDGFSVEQEVGDTNGLHYKLLVSDAHKEDVPLRWIVSVNTACYGCLIQCDSWPDLIELLAKLSPIALASIFDHQDFEAVRELLAPIQRKIEDRMEKIRQRYGKKP